MPALNSIKEQIPISPLHCSFHFDQDNYVNSRHKHVQGRKRRKDGPLSTEHKILLRKLSAE